MVLSRMVKSPITNAHQHARFFSVHLNQRHPGSCKSQLGICFSSPTNVENSSTPIRWVWIFPGWSNLQSQTLISMQTRNMPQPSSPSPMKFPPYSEGEQLLWLAPPPEPQKEEGRREEGRAQGVVTRSSDTRRGKQKSPEARRSELMKKFQSTGASETYHTFWDAGRGQRNISRRRTLEMRPLVKSPLPNLAVSQLTLV